jgi:hypothetical protein
MSQLLVHPADSSATPRWTVEQITRLDWKRIVEIMHELSSASGFSIGPTKVESDAAAEFVISTPQQRALVRLAPWKRWMASAGCVGRFAERLQHFQGHRGIYLAPEGFSRSALQVARVNNIETVDASALVARLNGLPAEFRDYYFDIAMAGEPGTPSCPHCLRPLVLAEESSADTSAGEALPDFRFAESDIIAEPVQARRIEVMARSEVQFLQEVHAREVVVHGVAHGDFVCEGRVVLHPGATLYGNVAARSVLVSPGAELIGETRIVADKPESFGRSGARRVWRCSDPRWTPGCKEVALDPHP